MATFNYSVIIPHRSSLHLLPTLLSSIPDRKDIEIIVVDNSPHPIIKDDILTNRNVTVLFSSQSVYAGGARNVGLDFAQGKWILFADADDYFSENAFDLFDRYLLSDHDIIFFGVSSYYLGTNEKSERAVMYQEMVEKFLNNSSSELDIRLMHRVPWAKMIKKSLIDKNNLRFEEIRAAEDAFFALKVGYYAKTISADISTAYILTDSYNSLSRQKTFDALHATLLSRLNINLFLKQKMLDKYQVSVMLVLLQIIKYYPRKFFIVIKDVILSKQNPFIGCTRWMRTLRKVYKNKNVFV